MSEMPTPEISLPETLTTAPARHPGRPLPRTMRWALPPLVVVVVGFLGVLLYMGGLGAPTAHFHEFPLAVVDEDAGARLPAADGSTTEIDLGRQVADELVATGGDREEIELRQMSRQEAQEALRSGEIYAAVIVPSDFSATSAGLVGAALGGDGDGARPELEVLTSPQAGSLSTRLASGLLDPMLAETSTSVGQQLRSTADEQIRGSEQAQRPAAQLTTVAAAVLADPLEVRTTAWQELPEGTALGMGPFYWAVVLLVVGVSGSVAVSTLVDALNGVTPWELGPRLRRYAPTGLSRLATFGLKWGLMLVGGAGAAGAMMLAGSIAGVPLPHGGLLFLVSWLGIATVSAVTLSLITVFGSAGMLLAMILLVFMGLPSAGAVSPPEALPGFFAALAGVEPLHHLWLGIRDILLFDARGDAGLGTGVRGMVLITACALALAAVVAPLWDRIAGRRGLAASTGRGRHLAAGAEGTR